MPVEMIFSINFAFDKSSVLYEYIRFTGAAYGKNHGFPPFGSHGYFQWMFIRTAFCQR
jgi:hypothetical protein